MSMEDLAPCTLTRTQSSRYTHLGLQVCDNAFDLQRKGLRHHEIDFFSMLAHFNTHSHILFAYSTRYAKYTAP